MDNFEHIKVCTSYKYQNSNIDYLPPYADLSKGIEPDYITIDGWKCNTKKMKSWDSFPQKAKNYIKKIEELIGIPIIMVSNGPERDKQKTGIPIIKPSASFIISKAFCVSEL